jgi:hypothetical protein
VGPDAALAGVPEEAAAAVAALARAEVVRDEVVRAEVVRDERPLGFVHPLVRDAVKRIGAAA